jgi:hypothetical protein
VWGAEGMEVRLEAMKRIVQGGKLLKKSIKRADG